MKLTKEQIIKKITDMGWSFKKEKNKKWLFYSYDFVKQDGHYKQEVNMVENENSIYIYNIYDDEYEKGVDLLAEEMILFGQLKQLIDEGESK